jgi:hypothetical protein
VQSKPWYFDARRRNFHPGSDTSAPHRNQSLVLVARAFELQRHARLIYAQFRARKFPKSVSQGCNDVPIRSEGRRKCR